MTLKSRIRELYLYNRLQKEIREERHKEMIQNLKMIPAEYRIPFTDEEKEIFENFWGG